MLDQESPKVVKQAEATPPEQSKPKTVAPEEFITRWPLYTPAPVEGFYPPDSISYHCETKQTCAKETTWMRKGTPLYVDASSGFNWVGYICGRCGKQDLVVMYRELEYENRPVRRRVASGLTRTIGPPPASTVRLLVKVQKVGQYPALSVSIPKGLEKNLGEDAINLYKKALVNRNEGYGLGAVTYIRRVVEDKTNELIEVAAQLAESHNIDKAIVTQIRAAATERTTYDQKLKIAATVLPDALLIDGLNPLYQLYGLVSEGVHGLSEAACIAVADETTSVFDFIFTNLRATTKARHDFVGKVKKWAGRSGTKSGSDESS